MGVSPPENHSKIGGDDGFDVISRKNFRDFSADFFENKGPPLCFFEKSSKIPKLNPGANRGGPRIKKILSGAYYSTKNTQCGRGRS